MKQALLRTIRAHQLWEPGSKVAVALSGGADSFALADLLVKTRGVHRADLSIVHVDHGQHDRSMTFAEVVRRWAATHGLPCVIERADLPVQASEAACRAARYAVFEQLAVDRVALGHHQDDQVETVLMRWIRGTGPGGLRAMARRRGRYVRPCLDMKRDRLHEYAQTTGLPVCEDPSNASLVPLRNRIRHELVPLVQNLRGSTESLARTAHLVAEDEVFLEGLARSLPLTVSVLNGAPRPLVRRRLAIWIPGLSTGQIEALLDVLRRGRGRVALDNGQEVVIIGETLAVREAVRADPG